MRGWRIGIGGCSMVIRVGRRGGIGVWGKLGGESVGMGRSGAGMGPVRSQVLRR